MRDVARALDRINKAARRGVVPRLVVLRPLQRVEGAVDLEGRKMARGELELAPLRQVPGVEDAAPRLVAPARDADADQASFTFLGASCARAFSSSASSVRARRRGVIET